MNRSKKEVRRRKADTRDVLGSNAVAPINPKWEVHQQRLLELRQKLEKQKQSLGEDAANLYTGIRREQADVATNSYDRDWALAVLSSDQNAILEINEALDRIRSGNYGKCELTGKPIPSERLEAVPWTRFTAEAERELEIQGEVPRPGARLHRPDTVPRESVQQSPEIDI
jgi:RNA polymerase-binding transcription factor DksA